MEARDQDVLSRYQQRLAENLEPDELSRYLLTNGVVNYDELVAIVRANREFSRQTGVIWLLESLRKCETGFGCFIKGLLISKKQDYLAREILEDEVYGENDIKLLLQDLEDGLDEIQVLKLELLRERKKHDNTKRELEEVKSSRNSMVFSEPDSSSCSGFDSSDTDAVSYLLRELEQEKKRREKAENAKRCHEQELAKLARKTEMLEESQRDFLRAAKSVENLKGCQKDDIWVSKLPWRASSLANLCHPDKICVNNHGGEVVKWKSDDSGNLLRKGLHSSMSSMSDNGTAVLELVGKVTCLENELREERTKREDSDFEIIKLELENEELQMELEETRDQLRDSQLDLTESMYYEESYDTDYENNEMDCLPSAAPHVCSDPCGSPECVGAEHERKHAFQFSDQRIKTSSFSTSTPVKEHPKAQRKLSHLSMSRSWRNLNVEHYEMDEYDHEIERKQSGLADFMEVLRRLKSDANILFNEVVKDGKQLRNMRYRAERLKSIEEDPH